MGTDISNSDDLIDVRDVIARVEELEEEIEQLEVDAPDTLTKLSDPELYDELATLAELLSDLKGNGGDEQWRGDWYPVTLIRDSYFTEYAKQLADDIGAINSEASWPTCHIDWDDAAESLQMDYSSVEYDGVTYWYR